MNHPVFCSRWVFSGWVPCLAAGFGSGLSRKAPGTAGSLAALPVGVLLLDLPVWGHAAWVVLMFALGVLVCDRAARLLGVHDHPGIVWDEFVGLWLAMWLLPDGWPWWLAAFVLFRLFDIAKPWPIRWLDRQVQGGFGIMIDDVLAGIFAWGVLQAAAWYLGVSRLF
ncbi:MAG: phosphatidylglycerophosphatase A [Gammaproteobacteria bacterium]|nr:MAG: phosphatidylglycerophosphatase A [Gammaproteobacteria bacterium]